MPNESGSFSEPCRIVLVNPQGCAFDDLSILECRSIGDETVPNFVPTGNSYNLLSVAVLNPVNVEPLDSNL
jgi:hypothetical protein